MDRFPSQFGQQEDLGEIHFPARRQEAPSLRYRQTQHSIPSYAQPFTIGVGGRGSRIPGVSALSKSSLSPNVPFRYIDQCQEMLDAPLTQGERKDLEIYHMAIETGLGIAPDWPDKVSAEVAKASLSDHEHEEDGLLVESRDQSNEDAADKEEDKAVKAWKKRRIDGQESETATTADSGESSTIIEEVSEIETAAADPSKTPSLPEADTEPFPVFEESQHSYGSSRTAGAGGEPRGAAPGHRLGDEPRPAPRRGERRVGRPRPERLTGRGRRIIFSPERATVRSRMLRSGPMAVSGAQTAVRRPQPGRVKGSWRPLGA